MWIVHDKFQSLFDLLFRDVSRNSRVFSFNLTLLCFANVSIQVFRFQFFILRVNLPLRMIVITGAAGFIGSCLVSQLNGEGQKDLILVDEFDSLGKRKNLLGKQYRHAVSRETFFSWVKGKEKALSAVFHLGARTDTSEQDWALFELLNVEYSQQIWNLCATHEIPLLYASSAATYGDGRLGFSDAPELIPQLRPLNPYGQSKQVVDTWVLQQEAQPPAWLGLKFFNVYGPNEYHKGRMASVVFHAYPQVRTQGLIRLFRSHRPEFADGEQLRDFIYVKDVVEIAVKWLTGTIESGIYNLGTGQARTFADLANAVFSAAHTAPSIEFIDIPPDIREAYQYFTEADMNRFRAAGFRHIFRSLEEGVDDYVTQYLNTERYF